MTGAVLCMAFYNVWSGRFIVRASALGFLSVGMGAGAAALILTGVLSGRVVVLESFSAAQWTAGIYLGIGGGACFHSVGDGAATHDTDTGGEYHDRQSDRSGFVGDPACR
jgi:hypothetical protein